MGASHQGDAIGRVARPEEDVIFSEDDVAANGLQRLKEIAAVASEAHRGDQRWRVVAQREKGRIAGVDAPRCLEPGPICHNVFSNPTGLI